MVLHPSIWLRLLRDTVWLSSRELGRAAQGSHGICMRQEYFLNKPIQRERDFGEQFLSKIPNPPKGQLVCP